MQYLSSLGHEVTVIINRRHYFDERIEAGKQGWTDWLKDEKNIRIISVTTTPGRRKNLIRRFINYLSFSFNAFKAGMIEAQPDVILVGTPPLVVPLIGILLGKYHSAFTILEIRDLYPETAKALGKLKNRFIEYLWEMWENLMRNHYDRIVAVVPDIRDSLIDKGFSDSKIYLITNGYDQDNDKPCNLPETIETFFVNNKEKFIVTYGGGMGYGNNLKTILEAAVHCKEKTKIVFAFFGEGELKQEYIRFLKAQKLNNCFFFDIQSRQVINAVYRRSSALIQSFWNNRFHRCVFTNKIFEYHGAGKPILFAGSGITANLIKNANSGIVVEAENPEALAKAISFLAGNPEKARQMGLSGKNYIYKHYRREIAFKRWDSLLNSLMAS